MVWIETVRNEENEAKRVCAWETGTSTAAGPAAPPPVWDGMNSDDALSWAARPSQRSKRQRGEVLSYVWKGTELFDGCIDR
jgi:hypothetical protein